MIIKVCGMRDPENIREVAALGVDWIGLIFFARSPRRIGFQYGKYNHTIGNKSNKIRCILDIYYVFRFCQWRYVEVVF